MVCTKCGNVVPDSDKFCSKCGTKVENMVEIQFAQQGIDNLAQSPIVPSVEVPVGNMNSTVIEEKKKNGNKKIIFIILCIVLGLIFLVLGIILVVGLIKPNRVDTLTNIEKNNSVSFKLNDKIYYIGDWVNKLRVDGIDYDTNFGQDIVYNDSISTRTFSDEEDVLFLGALYCSSKDDCKHSETVLVKANFYEDSDVVVNGFVKFRMDYEDIVKKYGKEDGRFYQDQELYVWYLDDKKEIGSPYMVLRFDEGGLFSWGGINEIRLGVFWYEGEADYIVVPDESEEEK